MAQQIGVLLDRLGNKLTGRFKPEISEIEQSLADLLNRRSLVRWHQQVKFKTAFGTFFLDMGCRINPQRAIGMECDGREFHLDKMREFCRDSLILGTGRLARLYHIEAWAIRKQEAEWTYLLDMLEPDLIKPNCADVMKVVFERGAGQCKALIEWTQRYRRYMYRRDPTMESVCRFLEFAKEHVGITFPELVERARQEEMNKGTFEVMPRRN